MNYIWVKVNQENDMNYIWVKVNQENDMNYIWVKVNQENDMNYIWVKVNQENDMNYMWVKVNQENGRNKVEGPFSCFQAPIMVRHGEAWWGCAVVTKQVNSHVPLLYDLCMQ